jgi:hypothetical protein
MLYPDRLRCVTPETRGVRVRGIIAGLAGTENAVANCITLKKVCKTFDDWYPFLLASPTLCRSTTRSGMILSTISLTLHLLLQATKWLIVWASCVLFITSGMTQKIWSNARVMHPEHQKDWPPLCPCMQIACRLFFFCYAWCF